MYLNLRGEERRGGREKGGRKNKMDKVLDYQRKTNDCMIKINKKKDIRKYRTIDLEYSTADHK